MGKVKNRRKASDPYRSIRRQVAPPSHAHKSARDYNRKRENDVDSFWEEYRKSLEGYPSWANITVICNNCGRINEGEIKEISDVSEDVQGRDVLEFRCPKCLTRQKSLRFG